MMFPSLRGGNDNPGRKEGFLGEVDDVLAAADFLATVDYVDPRRLYLGGHSTGGTLVLLVAESSDRFRAVFSFGPVDDVSGYGGAVPPVQHLEPPRDRAPLADPLAALGPVSDLRLRGNEPGQPRLAQGHVGRLDQSAAPFPPGQGRESLQHPRPHHRGPSPAKILADEGPATNIVRPQLAELDRPFGRMRPGPAISGLFGFSRR